MRCNYSRSWPTPMADMKGSNPFAGGMSAMDVGGNVLPEGRRCLGRNKGRLRKVLVMPQVFDFKGFPAPALILVLILALLTACSKEELEPEAEKAPGHSSETASPPSTDSDRFGSKYAELRAQGKSHKAASELARIYTGGSTGSGASQISESQHAMDAAIVLARFSTTEKQESFAREQAAEELTMRFQSRELEADRALELLNTITPEASISDRREAARSLARLSQADDWDEEHTKEAANELVMLITGDALDAERRINAATELARRSIEGGLDVEGTLNLVNRIAPGLSIEKRREAANDFVTLWKSEQWDSETTDQLAEKGFQVLTGGELNYEKRQDAVVDIAGESIKTLMGDDYDADEIDAAAEVLKSGLRGELSEDTMSNFLNRD